MRCPDCKYERVLWSDTGVCRDCYQVQLQSKIKRLQRKLRAAEGVNTRHEVELEQLRRERDEAFAKGVALSKQLGDVRATNERIMAENSKNTEHIARLVSCVENRDDQIERLRDLKRSCECSEEDQCSFARERDEAREAARWLYRHHVLMNDGVVDHDLPDDYETEQWPWLEGEEAVGKSRDESECHSCGSISGVYLQMCDDCVTRFNQQEAELNHFKTQLREQCEMYNVDIGQRDEEIQRLNTKLAEGCSTCKDRAEYARRIAIQEDPRKHRWE